MKSILHNVRSDPLLQWDYAIRNHIVIWDVQHASETLKFMHPALFMEWANWIGYEPRPQPRDDHPVIETIRNNLLANL